jgi:protein TonB
MTMRISPDVQLPEAVLIGRIDPPAVEPPPPPPPMPKPVLRTEFTTPKIPVVDPMIPDPLVDTVPMPPSDPGPVEMVSPEVGTGTDIVPAIPSTALKYSAIRPADDYYPYASRTLQEEGIATVRVCVAPTGKLEGSPVIQTSSGSTRLDAAALKWAREALRFTPATERGVPVSACKGFRVHFTLH